MKDIIGGLIAGIVLAIAQIYLLNGTQSMAITTVLLGTFIGWFHKDLNHGFINIVIFSIINFIIGALFFVYIAVQSGLWLQSLAIGAITGVIIAVIMKLGFKPKYD